MALPKEWTLEDVAKVRDKVSCSLWIARDIVADKWMHEAISGVENIEDVKEVLKQMWREIEATKSRIP